MSKHKKKTPVGACPKCNACCTETFVPVSDSDIRRLIQETGSTADRIVRFCANTDLEYDPDSALWIRTGYGKRILCLRQRPGGCQFLSDEGFCRVYSTRPMTCRTYPYGVHFDKRGRVESVTIDHTVGCGARLGGAWTKRSIVAHARQEEAEDEVYLKKLRQWEQRGSRGGKRGLLKFLGF